MRFRGGAGAGGVRLCCGDSRLGESGVPKGAERFQTGPEAAGPGKGAPGLEHDAFLQGHTAERFTSYLSAIRVRTKYFR